MQVSRGPSSEKIRSSCSATDSAPRQNCARAAFGWLQRRTRREPEAGALVVVKPVNEWPVVGARPRSTQPAASLRALFDRLDRQFTELQGQLERTAVGFGELKVEQAEIRGLGSGAHRAGATHWPALNEKHIRSEQPTKAYSQRRPTDK